MKNGKFSVDGVEYQLSRNDFGTDNRHHVHGGYNSFDRMVWQTNRLQGRGGHIYPMEIDNLATSIFIHKILKYENLPSFSSIGPLHSMSISI